MTKIMNIFKNRMFQAAVGMTVGTILYCAAIVFILDLGNFYAGGLTGVSQIFETIYLKYISSANAEGVAGLKSLVISFLNLPLFIIGWKGVSKRFAILSLASVLIQVVFIALFEYIRIDLGINPVASMANNPLMLCILGGLVLGGVGTSVIDNNRLPYYNNYYYYPHSLSLYILNKLFLVISHYN